MKMYKSSKIVQNKSELLQRVSLIVLVFLLSLSLLTIPSSLAVKAGSIPKITEVNVYDDDTYTYKCSEIKLIYTNGVNLNASKTKTGFIGVWKMNSSNYDEKISGKITSGKIMSNDKEGLTPVSFSGTIVNDIMCNDDTNQDRDSEIIQISTYCFADDSVYLTFKGIITSKDLAHVQCR